MTTAAWIALLTTWTVAVVSPGPDFVAVLRSGAAHGRRDAFAVATGVTVGIASWIVVALTGLSVVIAAHTGLYTGMRIAGALFLAGFGLHILWATRGRSESGGGEPQSLPNVPRSLRAAFRLGLLTNLANPKALVFFGALLASLLPAHTSSATKLLVTASMLSVALTWFGVCAVLSGSEPVTRLYDRARKGIDRLLGVVFIGLGGAILRHS